jgi:hypothetical protein
MASDYNGAPAVAGGSIGAQGAGTPQAAWAQTTNTIGGILGGNPVLDPGAILLSKVATPLGSGQLANTNPNISGAPQPGQSLQPNAIGAGGGFFGNGGFSMGTFGGSSGAIGTTQGVT